jgi:hypothetical protein
MLVLKLFKGFGLNILGVNQNNVSAQSVPPTKRCVRIDGLARFSFKLRGMNQVAKDALPALVLMILVGAGEPVLWYDTDKHFVTCPASRHDTNLQVSGG